ncbi:hypothetical protein AB0I28_28800 [Phytomonospora sp. NPDC050363]|uniref:hypothetical protein n=1 Tax=Phytomonospora sp. NPDC050363 TaxID=3155642 RepID=UPI0033E45EE4
MPSAPVYPPDAQAWPAPAYPPPPPPPAPKRKVLPFVIGLAVVVAIGGTVPFLVSGPDTSASIVAAPSPSDTGPRPLLADDVFIDDFEVTAEGGDVYGFERIGAWDHDGDCPKAGKGKASEKFLAGCVSRVEGAYETRDGKFRFATQIFGFSESVVSNPGLRKPPEDFELDWRPKSMMEGPYWWGWDAAGDYLIIVYVGPVRTFNARTDKATEALVGRIREWTVNAVKESVYW